MYRLQNIDWYCQDIKHIVSNWNQVVRNQRWGATVQMSKSNSVGYWRHSAYCLWPKCPHNTLDHTDSCILWPYHLPWPHKPWPLQYLILKALLYDLGGNILLNAATPVLWPFCFVQMVDRMFEVPFSPSAYGSKHQKLMINGHMMCCICMFCCSAYLIY